MRVRKNIVARYQESLNSRKIFLSQGIRAAQIPWSTTRASLNELNAETVAPFAVMNDVLNGVAQTRTDETLNAALETVRLNYSQWQEDTEVPLLSAALRAIKRGNLGAEPTSLDELKAQAAMVEPTGKKAATADFLYNWTPFLSERAPDRITSLTRLQALIAALPKKPF